MYSNFLLITIFCCFCLILISIIISFVYILSSQKVRNALLTLALIKDLYIIGKEFYNSFFKGKSVSSNKKTSSKEDTKQVIDAEFREK